MDRINNNNNHRHDHYHYHHKKCPHLNSEYTVGPYDKYYNMQLSQIESLLNTPTVLPEEHYSKNLCKTIAHYRFVPILGTIDE